MNLHDDEPPDNEQPGNGPPGGDLPGTSAEEFDAIKDVDTPKFWPNRPTLWFVQLEAQFRVHKIIKDDSKFYKTISALDMQSLGVVAHIVQNPPAQGKYTALKKALVDCYTESEEKHIRKLLSGKKLGDRKPTELLREMREQAGNNFNDDVLKAIWIDAMPNDGWLRQYLMTAEAADLNALAAKADVVVDSLNAHSIAAIQPKPSTQSEENAVLSLR